MVYRADLHQGRRFGFRREAVEVAPIDVQADPKTE